MKPTPTIPAKTRPQGKSIDCQNKNFRLTRLAFWTDSRAINMIQTAAIAEIIRLVITIPNY
jgi:hypothetical protein